MDKRIGTYAEDGRRVLPELTIAGNPVRHPITTTQDIGSNQFVVIDNVLSKAFDIQAEIEKLRTGASVPVQPNFGERLLEDPPVRDVGTPMPGSFSNDVPAVNDASLDNTLPGDMSTRGRK